MDIYEQARRAVQGAVAPNMNIENPNLARAFSESMNTTAANVVGDAMQGATKEDAEAQREREAAARAAENARRKEQAAMHEKNAKGEGWQQVRRDDGGYDYYDAFGKKVNLWTYTQYTGKDPRDVLKGSQNELDMQFLEDYDSTEKAMKAYAKGKQNSYWNGVYDSLLEETDDPEDEGNQKEAERKARELRARFEGDGDTASPLIRLKQYYPNVFGQSGSGQMGRRFSG